MGPQVRERRHRVWARHGGKQNPNGRAPAVVQHARVARRLNRPRAMKPSPRRTNSARPSADGASGQGTSPPRLGKARRKTKPKWPSASCGSARASRQAPQPPQGNETKPPANKLGEAERRWGLRSGNVATASGQGTEENKTQMAERQLWFSTRE